MPKKSNIYESGHDRGIDYGIAGNDSFLSSDNNDLAEGAGCKCNCNRDCEPKGCRGLRGRTIKARSLDGN